MNNENPLGDIVVNLKREAKELRKEIDIMKHILTVTEDKNVWTPKKFAIIVSKSNKEIKRLRRTLQECLDCDNFEKILDL